MSNTLAAVQIVWDFNIGTILHLVILVSVIILCTRSILKRLSNVEAKQDVIFQILLMDGKVK